MPASMFSMFVNVLKRLVGILKMLVGMMVFTPTDGVMLKFSGGTVTTVDVEEFLRWMMVVFPTEASEMEVSESAPHIHDPGPIQLFRFVYRKNIFKRWRSYPDGHTNPLILIWDQDTSILRI